MSESDPLVDEIVDRALGVPIAEREGYIEKACAGDAQLRQTVTAMILAHEQAGVLLGKGLAARRQAEPSSALPGAEKEGDQIGRYKLLQKIGEGGCGAVYMAEQQEPVQRLVALKIIKLGMDSKQVVARFEAERQALALMDHPNIAKVLDGGTTRTGRPFFVMELVKGISITRFCDQRQLDTRQRLDLFVQVCRAIQHAHQKGVIHRDIKPSNILVADHDGVPVPKVIDFGIAKATTGQTLTNKTLFTAFEQFIGTPAYMSPEQAKLSGLDIDTRSDIYSLGVLLYELLIGNTPFDSKQLVRAGLQEVCRIIREQEPPRPSTRLSTLAYAEQSTVARHRQCEPPKLVSLLRGDLDWIVMKTLEKDRNRRYETANGLARDIERHLNNEPVAARPPSATYRLQKLVRRHKVGVAAAGAVLGALVLGLGLSAWLFTRERATRKQVSAEAQKSRQVVRFLRDMLAGVGPSAAKGKDTALLREILDKTASRITTELTNRPDVDAELRLIMSRTYDELGDYTNALTMVREALRLRRSLYPNGHPGVAQALNNLSIILQDHGDLEGAEAAEKEAVAICRRFAAADPAELGKSLVNLANVLEARGDLPGAEAAAREGLAFARKAHPHAHSDLVGALSTLANVLGDTGNLDENERLNREALAMVKALEGEVHPTVARLTGNLAITLLIQQRDLAAAEAMQREALALNRKLYGEVHPAVAEALGNVGTVLMEEGEVEEAERSYRQALEMRRKLFSGHHPDVILSLEQLAQLYVVRNDLAEGEKALEEVLALQQQAFGEEHPEIASSLHGLAIVHGKRGDIAGSNALEQRALAMRKRLYPAEHLAIAESLNQLGTLAAAGGELDQASSLLGQALAVLGKLQRTNTFDAGSVLWTLGWVRQQAGDINSRSLCQQAVSVAIQDANRTRILTGAIYDLVDLLEVQGKCAEAEPLLSEAWTCWEKCPVPEKAATWKAAAAERHALFYEKWNQSAPSADRAAKANEWRGKLDALQRQGEGQAQKKVDPNP
ncbi:MAG TPA: serine/threonine-protein kinase [Verrucomicrobiae bacterium]